MTDDQHAQIVALLTDIRDALAYLCQPVPEDDEPTACEHATENRTDFSTPREVHWQCNACGHIERRSLLTSAPADSPRAEEE
jgi:hypothetical protein